MVHWHLLCECISSIEVQFQDLVILSFREGRDFLGDLREQRDPSANRGNAEMCGIEPLSVCYRDAGNTHTLLSEHNISQGTSRHKNMQICGHTEDFLPHCVFVQFKERDELARIFKTWMQPQSSSIFISKAWDYRVRQHLGTRYDSKNGCFDWDLNMKLHEKGVLRRQLILPLGKLWPKRSRAFNFTLHSQCSIIQKHQYVRWRERGVAFELREGAYELNNPSLLSSRVFNQVGF